MSQVFAHWVPRLCLAYGLLLLVGGATVGVIPASSSAHLGVHGGLHSAFMGWGLAQLSGLAVWLQGRRARLGRMGLGRGIALGKWAATGLYLWLALRVFGGQPLPFALGYLGFVLSLFGSALIAQAKDSRLVNRKRRG